MGDLIGSEVPFKDGFKFQSGPLLKAIESGGIILIDEINLASQSVLEGLNSILDERRSIFVPELNIDIRCPPEFLLFASMNPNSECGRKKLNCSFRSRFVEIWVDAFTSNDLENILESLTNVFKCN